jgi:hypothetical protein
MVLCVDGVTVHEMMGNKYRSIKSLITLIRYDNNIAHEIFDIKT